MSTDQRDTHWDDSYFLLMTSCTKLNKKCHGEMVSSCLTHMRFEEIHHIVHVVVDNIVQHI